MRIFVAGATGALGKRLVPQLIAAGHTVTGLTRSPGKADDLRRMGAEPVVADALDRTAINDAMANARPEVVIHELTAIPANLDLRKLDQAFAATNRLRTEGTDILIEAARSAGARRFIAQSYAPLIYAREGGPVKTEDDALDTQPASSFRNTLDAINYLERAVLTADGLEGVVLRYGGFYGPGTNLAPGGSMLEPVRKRQFPIVGKGSAVWSFIHIEDAAAATVAAVERGEGVYNITDDDPAPVSEWLPYLAETIGAGKPWKVPLLLGRLFAGEAGVIMMTESRGASNAKAKRELGWQPGYASWREGFREGLGEETESAAA
ncbi:MAG TPA: NAD(P)-dependent oxidoreductase [Dehalococcoidia bacterium]|nr:NAD(P)-dependent oxidoreductase [Dehalococcoidia bacterium]